jgi:hypothetical protein
MRHNVAYVKQKVNPDGRVRRCANPGHRKSIPFLPFFEAVHTKHAGQKLRAKLRRLPSSYAGLGSTGIQEEAEPKTQR